MLKVITHNFEFIGAIDEYSSFIANRSYFNIGSFELHLPFTTEYAEILGEENIIFMTPDKPYIILYKEINSDDNSMVVKGEELKHYIGRWITKPPDNMAYHRINADAETIMKTYVLANCKTPSLEVAQNLNRGDKIVFQTRYKQLDDELAKIGLATGLGWTVRLDLSNKRFIFDILQGVDRTTSQSLNSRAIFSDDFDNVKGQTLIESKIGYKNVAIVAGQGQGASRKIVEIGEASGFDRFETFIDARDIADDADLPDRGKQKLSEFGLVKSFESEILAYSNLVYEKDYNLGDIVTIQNKEWGRTIDSTIETITEIYEVSGLRLEASFGNAPPTITQVVKQKLDTPLLESVNGAFNYDYLDGGSTSTVQNVTVDMGKANDFIAIILEGGNINGN